MRNCYIDVRGAHPILVFGLQAIELTNVHRTISIDGLQRLLAYEFANASSIVFNLKKVELLLDLLLGAL